MDAGLEAVKNLRKKQGGRVALEARPGPSGHGVWSALQFQVGLAVVKSLSHL